MRVLLVDDSAAVRRRLLELLAESDRLELHEAETVQAAKRLLDATPFEIVVVDIRLGGESGLELIGAVKQRRPSATVVVVTNDATAAHERVYRARGADYFFDKSRDFERVAELIAELEAAPSARERS